MGDPLTGLADRWGWQTHSAPILSSSDDHRPATLLFTDLDGFKAVNNHLGHVTGDAVLVAVSDVLRGVAGNGGLVARLGGDEFAALLPATGLDTALTVARRLCSGVGALRIPVDTVAGLRHVSGLSVSVGIAAHTCGRTLGDLTMRADAALITAKRSGRGGIHIFDTPDTR